MNARLSPCLFLFVFALTSCGEDEKPDPTTLAFEFLNSWGVALIVLLTLSNWLVRETKIPNLLFMSAVLLAIPYFVLNFFLIKFELNFSLLYLVAGLSGLLSSILAGIAIVMAIPEQLDRIDDDLETKEK
ncbi:MAG: hypothetical protein ACI8UO_000740 [Verrucomicrobiales bacterium]|jgi:hypothetical protein